MKKEIGFLFKILIVGVLISQFSCRKDFDSIASNGNLTFSSDTIFLDTVFNNLTTTTHLLTVYNKSKEDIYIPKIQLGKSDSKYRLNVDGIPGSEFENVLLLKEDSLFVMIETTVDISETNDEMLYTDQILFDPYGNLQQVDLITLVKEATLLYPNEGSDFELTDTTFETGKSYVIYGNAIVPQNSSLTVEAGSMVYFNDDANLILENGSTFNVMGTLQDSVVFRSDNLNYNYNQVAGQWGGIKIEENVEATINYLQILNPSTGLEIINNSTPITIKNTEIYNASNYSVYAENANITAENLVFGQARISNLNLRGGTYNFTHCSFANYWNDNIRTTSNLIISNYTTNSLDVSIEAPLYQANFTNCIIGGNKKNEIDFDTLDDFESFSFYFTHCLINLENGEEFLNTENTSFYNNCLFNQTLDFKDSSINDLRIGLENKGIAKATTTTVSLDIVGTDRTVTPDIGAYQHIDFETLEPKNEDD